MKKLSDKFREELKEAICSLIDSDNFEHLNLQKIICTAEGVSDAFIHFVFEGQSVPDYFYTNYQLSSSFIRIFSENIDKTNSDIWSKIAKYQK